MQSPHLGSHIPTENVPKHPVQMRSPFCGVLQAAMQSAARGYPVAPGTEEFPVHISSDESPPPVKIVTLFPPFCLPNATFVDPLQTNEMRFKAIARQQAVPVSLVEPTAHCGRQEGRLRRKVSTPTFIQAPIVCFPPRLPRPIRPRIASPIGALVSEASGNMVTTPSEVERTLTPKILFPNSPFPSFLHVVEGSPDSPVSRYYAYASVAIQCCLETRDNACEILPQPKTMLLHVPCSCDAEMQTSPRLHESLTLYDLHKELRALLIGMGL